MSKAFTKEDSGSESDDLASELPNFDEEGMETDEEGGEDGQGKPKAPRGAKNYITIKGLNVLKAELHELLTVERPKVVEVVAWAASNGDRSENADYQYGKKRLREIDRRIRFLQKRIDIAEAVDPEKQKGDKVLFGATVTVRDEESRQRIYKIVGVDETDAKAGKVSWISPIGQVLLQASEGDAVTLKTPRGDEELEIEKIQFIAID
jgi:transcription elongation factor GreB